jgi:hypothetical protein
MLQVYYIFTAIISLYLFARARNSKDLFLKILLVAVGFMLVLRVFPIDVLRQMAHLLYLLSLIASIPFILMRFMGKGIRLLVPLAQLGIMLLYLVVAIGEPSFNQYFFGYLSILCAVLLVFAYRTGLLKTYGEFALIMLVIGCDAIAITIGQLFLNFG